MMGGQDPMRMLQNADPKQIKQMLRMVKDNREHLRLDLPNTPCRVLIQHGVTPDRHLHFSTLNQIDLGV